MAETSTIQPQPEKIRLAVKLQYVSLLIGIIRLLISIILGGQNPITVASSAILVWAILLFLIKKINQGRNWARLTIIILFFLGLLPEFFVILHYLFIHNFSQLVFQIPQAVLQGWAVILLMNRESVEWFKQEK